MKVRVQGYKVKNYDATYEKANFLFEEVIVGENQRNIKIHDLASGLEIWIPAPIRVETPSQKSKRN